MLRRAHLVLSAVMLAGVVFLLAVGIQAGNDADPVIVYFTSDQRSISYSELQSGNARVRVKWSVTNRPITANLVFLQYLPASDTYTNVELPRPWLWVNSTDTGVVAPYMPNDESGLIRLRLQLIDRLTDTVLDEAELDIEIRADDLPDIDYFGFGQNYVSAAELEIGSEIIRVDWRVVNRPQNSNLAFEQIMPDGEVINVELPRDNPWVASEGVGVVQPRQPENQNHVRFQLRLYSTQTGSTIVSRIVDVPIASVDDTPQITRFTTDNGYVTAAALEQETVRVPVSWVVERRPPDTNLVFEQVMPDQTFHNAELPRDNPWVASTGTGLMVPVMPGSNPENIVLQVRLVNLLSGQTLATKQITLPINYPSDWTTLDVQPRTARPLDTVTLAWNRADGSDAEIYMEFLSGDSTLKTKIGTGTGARLNASGTMDVQIPSSITGDSITFSMSGASPVVVQIAQDGDDTTTCTYEWFVDLDQSEPCPDTALQTAQAAFQPFENGFMVWRDGKIWAFYSSGGGITVIDTYTGGEAPFWQDPPEGLYHPIRGFGKAWVEIDLLREALGWATAPEESYTMEFQSAPVSSDSPGGNVLASSGARLYTFTLPEGHVMTATVSSTQIVEWSQPVNR